MNYRRVTQFPCHLIRHRGCDISVNRRHFGCDVQPCRISIAFFRLAPARCSASRSSSSLRPLSRLVGSASAWPRSRRSHGRCPSNQCQACWAQRKYIAAYHDQRRLRSAGLHSRRTRDRLGTSVKPNWTIRDLPLFASVFYWLFSDRNFACSRLSLWL